MTGPLRRLWLRWRRSRTTEARAREPARAEPDAADFGTTLGLEISVPSRSPRAGSGRPPRRGRRA